MKIFGERLRKLREMKHMNQEDLSKLVRDKKGRPVTKQTISYYESGKFDPSIESLVNIAAHFGVTIDYLLGLSDYMNAKHENHKGMSIFSEEAIEGLSTLYSDRAIEILNILFQDNRFAMLLYALHTYYEGISDELLQNTMIAPQGIYFASDMDTYRRQYMNFVIGHLTENILKYLDEVKEG